MRATLALFAALWPPSAAAGQALTSSTSSVAPRLEPPEALTPTQIALPAGVVLSEEQRVVVRVHVDSEGEVARVELVSSATTALAHAVLEGAAGFRFRPARYGGRPVPVAIQFTQRFLPPPPPLRPGPIPAASGALAGRIVERGTRRPVGGATVLAVLGDQRISTETDREGHFRLELPLGSLQVQVLSPSHEPFRQEERLLGAGDRVEVTYLLTRVRRNPYEVVVVGKLEQEEVARTTLRGAEIKQVPGTFGDPFRVIGALPGVSPMMSLLPFPVVRGSSPGNTGFLIDGVRVPLLFHLLAGPSVLHPELIDEVSFAPGGFPVEYGGYVGGVVDGRTRSAGRGEQRYDLDLNLFQAGGLVLRELPAADLRITASGRYGFPGPLISLATPRVDLTYWDYQLRLDTGSPRSGFSFFFFGARDALDAIPNGEPDTAEKVPLLHFHFHRADLRYEHRTGAVRGRYQLTLGYDDSQGQEDARLSALELSPRAKLSIEVTPSLELRLGFDGQLKRADFETPDGTVGEVGALLGDGSEPSDLLLSGGLWAEALYRPLPDLLLRPGVRLDVYSDTTEAKLGADPRVLARYTLEPSRWWVKAALGLYHQPPRFTIPLPGLDQLAFQRGLLEAWQTSAGTELALGDGFSLDLQGYFNFMDPILYDVQLNPTVEDVINTEPAVPPGQAPPEPPRNPNSLSNRLDKLLQPATGRSFGAELLLRRRSSEGLSGWLAYTLSRSERLRDGRYVAFDFDRTHILNLVLTMPLPRQWQIGLRAQLQAGRPLTTTAGLASARAATFVRFDLRIDKTATWNDWLLDFYVDISNVVLGPEELAPGNELRYVLPTVGFRAWL